MSNAAAPSPIATSAKPNSKCRATLHWFRIVLSCAAISITIGWIAFQLQRQSVVPAFFFPLLFPLLVGAVAGAATTAVFRATGERNRATLAILASVTSIGIVSMEIGCGYRAYLTEIDAGFDKHPEAILLRANDMNAQLRSFHRFMATQREHIILWWLGDAMLTVIGSVAALIAISRPEPRPSRDRILNSTN